MTDSKAKTDPVPAARRRKVCKRDGFERVAVWVRSEDAALLQHVAAALVDPAREAETRDTLRRHVAATPYRGLKALLETAPLGGFHLERSHDQPQPTAVKRTGFMAGQFTVPDGFDQLGDRDIDDLLEPKG